MSWTHHNFIISVCKGFVHTVIHPITLSGVLETSPFRSGPAMGFSNPAGSNSRILQITIS